MIKIYIAGKITGECDTPEDMQNCIKKFNNYAYSLVNKEARNNKPLPRKTYFIELDDEKSFIHGFIINHKLIRSGSGTWAEYMKNDIKTMLTCDEVHFLPDWRESKGAVIERNLAESLGMKIIDTVFPYQFGEEIHT